MLYLVPTPIGNLEDITMRAIRILKEANFILAEDTRVTKRLLDKYEITTKLHSFHAHNEHKKLDKIIAELKSGVDVAMVSDAGTPGISDPGFLLVRECVKEDIPLTCLPGPTALIPALVMSGLPCDKFYFEGFLPQKKGKQSRLQFLLDLDCTFMMYESPFRVIKTLEMIQKLSETERQVCVSREVSKMYEENVRGTISDVLSDFKERQSVKGEFVIIVSGK